MKLTQEQITYIEKYINKNDIKYYEVYMEILDHIILSVEDILEHDKEISFEDAVLKAKNDFGFKGFKGLVKERQEFLNKKNVKDYGNAIKTFFTFPKILFTLSVFVSFYFFIGFFENPKRITVNSIVFLLVISLLQLKHWYKYRKIEGFKLLKNQFYIYGINSVALWINFINILGSNGEKGADVFYKLLFSSCFIMSFLSLLIFIEIRKKTIKELQTQIFV